VNGDDDTGEGRKWQEKGNVGVVSMTGFDSNATEPTPIGWGLGDSIGSCIAPSRCKLGY
jgi:hypothetical protein